jgi:hypothetical protein
MKRNRFLRFLGSVTLGLANCLLADEPAVIAHTEGSTGGQWHNFLQLTSQAVSDRASLTRPLEAREKHNYAQLDGPGCIHHIWVAMRPTENANRQVILRIFFDDSTVPHIEAPVGDFFGLMHGKAFYPIDTPYLSVKSQSGYNCYFRMPFAKNARIEFEGGPTRQWIYLMVDWHRYPGQTLTETQRFCARWRREMPTQAYGEDYFMLDADGPGRLIGFVYGVRLIDNTDRWSHGGSDNIYIDGGGEYPAFLRGIGGEDTFGTSYGGALHTPETHLYAGMPYYTHEDVGEARPAQRLVGYRFYEPEPILFRESIHVRFGCMANDICSTVYWYQSGPVRPFFNVPSESTRLPGQDLPKGTCDLPLPDCGTWWLCGPFDNTNDRSLENTLEAERSFSPNAQYGEAKWVKQAGIHGFTDFGHVFRPRRKGVAVSHLGVIGLAHCILDLPQDMTVRLRLAWDDHLVLRINDEKPRNLGRHTAFRCQTVEVPLHRGPNRVWIKLSNEIGSNHGGWVFAFQAHTADGKRLWPLASQRQ